MSRRAFLYVARSKDDHPYASSVGWLGGRPFLPLEIEWPRTRSGKSMWFVGQLNLGHFSTEMWNGFGPRDGWLSFFFHGYPGHDLQCCVFHFSSSGHPHCPPLDTPPIEEWLLYERQHLKRRREFPIGLLTVSDNMKPCTEFKVLHQVGGLPWSAHEGLWPLFDKERLKSMREGKLESYEYDLGIGTTKPPFDFTNHLLLQVGPDRSIGWNWGDLGSLSFIVPEADLKMHRFDRVRVAMVCN